jgi:hypothetical protein
MVHSAMFFLYGQTLHRAVESGDDWELYIELDLQTAMIALLVGIIGFVVQRRSARKA